MHDALKHMKMIGDVPEVYQTHHSKFGMRPVKGYSAKRARAGKDIGKPGKNFAKIASSAAKRYGSAEAGKRVAGAILAKLRRK